ncbi:MAG: class I tRNA ligase family protein, partial [Alphaproteobacteria bacterium]|nr:class I tRNA ligase family protein [Alphaproteobacteria bacterium]
LGWPDGAPELERFYPTNVLVTGFDIIFFWVARMMMLGIKFMGEVPFRDIYIHGLVRDERGQKMSKSKGNVIDPLDLIEKYGADALRFTILASTGPGRDIKFGASRVEGYRNFATKLWNAARFTEINGCELDPAFDPKACENIVNRWIVSKLHQASAEIKEAFEQYRFNEAASTLYQFTWNEFCDWYVELAKPMLQGDDAAERAETQKTAAWVLAKMLHLLHPATPFVTEELWSRRFGSPGGPLISAAWPELGDDLVDETAEAEIDWLVRTVGAIRTARNEIGVPAGAKVTLSVHGAADETRERLRRHQAAIQRLARLAEAQPSETAIAKGSLQVVVDEATYALPLADVIDLDQERQRLDKELSKALADLAKIEKKLGNPQFLDRAPAEVVEEQRSRQAEMEQNREKLQAALARIAD